MAGMAVVVDGTGTSVSALSSRSTPWRRLDSGEASAERWLRVVDSAGSVADAWKSETLTDSDARADRVSMSGLMMPPQWMQKRLILKNGLAHEGQ